MNGSTATLVNVRTVGDCIARAATKWPESGVVLPDERVTYPELDSRIDDYARSLLGLGVGLHNKVGLLLPQSTDYLAALFAVARIGTVGVPINARYKSCELTHVIGNSDMRVLLTSSEDGPHAGFLPLVAGALHDAPERRHVVAFGEPAGGRYVSADDFWAAGAGVSVGDVHAAGRRVMLRDVAFIMYTSGTSANPKGAMITHEAIVRQSDTVARTRLFADHRDRVWTPLTMFHIGGVAFALSCANVGATYVHAGNFQPGVAVRQLVEERVTVALPAFETIWLAVLHHPDFDAGALDALRLVFNIGVPERLRGMQELLPNAPQVSGFGGTEACGFLTIGLAGEPLAERVETTGFPLEGMDLRVVDPDTGVDVGPGVLGEIRLRGYARFDGYYGDPELTAEAIDGDGWFHSGDMGTLDADGRLTYVTRLKDMLKVGGENVAAAEIESHLLTHPAVLMAQVVSAPDARYVEVPCAFIVRRPDATATEDELVEHCLGQIATFKVPRYVRFVDEYPMSGTKVRKHVLRDQIAADLAAAGITEAPKLRRPR